LFQPLLDAFRRPFVRERGGSQGEHRGHWLAQVVSGLPDGAWPLLRTGQIFPGCRRRVDCLTYYPAYHVLHPE
jgi:hypothetical protein